MRYKPWPRFAPASGPRGDGVKVAVVRAELEMARLR